MKIIIDSGSTDNTLDVVSNYQCKIYEKFNHRGTRNRATKSMAIIIVYLTQDTVPVDISAIEKLIEPIIKNEYIRMSCRRQLSHQNV